MHSVNQARLLFQVKNISLKEALNEAIREYNIQNLRMILLQFVDNSHRNTAGH